MCVQTGLYRLPVAPGQVNLEEAVAGDIVSVAGAGGSKSCKRWKQGGTNKLYGYSCRLQGDRLSKGVKLKDPGGHKRATQVLGATWCGVTLRDWWRQVGCGWCGVEKRREVVATLLSQSKLQTPSVRYVKGLHAVTQGTARTNGLLGPTWRARGMAVQLTPAASRSTTVFPFAATWHVRPALLMHGRPYRGFTFALPVRPPLQLPPPSAARWPCPPWPTLVNPGRIDPVPTSCYPCFIPYLKSPRSHAAAALAFAAAAAIGDTVAAPSVATPLDPGRIDPPTLAMVFGPNDSPLAGRAGKALTGRAIGERLQVGWGGAVGRGSGRGAWFRWRVFEDSCHVSGGCPTRRATLAMVFGPNE